MTILVIRRFLQPRWLLPPRLRYLDAVNPLVRHFKNGEIHSRLLCFFCTPNSLPYFRLNSSLPSLLPSALLCKILDRITIMEPPSALPINPREQKPTRFNHTDEEWAAQREAIRELYIYQNHSLKEMMTIMRDMHGFQAG